MHTTVPSVPLPKCPHQHSDSRMEGGATTPTHFIPLPLLKFISDAVPSVPLPTLTVEGKEGPPHPPTLYPSPFSNSAKMCESQVPSFYHPDQHFDSGREGGAPRQPAHFYIPPPSDELGGPITSAFITITILGSQVLFWILLECTHLTLEGEGNDRSWKWIPSK